MVYFLMQLIKKKINIEPPVLGPKLIQQPIWLAETADPQKNEKELIIYLFTQQHGPTLLLSAPAVALMPQQQTGGNDQIL